MEMKKKPKLTPEQLADAARLKDIFEQQPLSQLKFANQYDLGTQGMVGHYLNGRSPLNLPAAAKFAKGLGVSIAAFSPTLAALAEELNNGLPTSPPNARRAGWRIDVANGDDDSYVIPYHYAKGSCGGGSINHIDTIKGELRKEPSWFKKYQVNPHDTLTIYADGESMEPYIMDGDMVVIDTSKTEPVSGFVYLISHPDGERLKRLRREIDGTWILESDNTNKRMYPDERISPEYAELMKVIGRVIYRQG